MNIRYGHEHCTLGLEDVITVYFQSLGSEPKASLDVAKRPFNRAKNRFANILPCKYFGLLCVVLKYVLEQKLIQVYKF